LLVLGIREDNDKAFLINSFCSEVNGLFWVFISPDIFSLGAYALCLFLSQKIIAPKFLSLIAAIN